MDGIFSSFIWSYKKARRAIELLKLPFSKGGLDFPGFKLYFWSAFLGRMRSLVNSSSNPLFYYTFLLGEKEKLFLHRTNDPNYFKRVKFKIARDIVFIWWAILNKYKLSIYHSKLPLWDNPVLPGIFHEGGGMQWDNLGIKGLYREYAVKILSNS